MKIVGEFHISRRLFPQYSKTQPENSEKQYVKNQLNVETWTLRDEQADWPHLFWFILLLAYLYNDIK